MDCKIWFRNPELYVRQLLEVAHFDWAWDSAFLSKRRMDPVQFSKVHVPPGVHWRALVGGKHTTTLFDETSRHREDPVAVFPTWSAKRGTLDELVHLLENPWGEDRNRCKPERKPGYRAIWGQPNWVWVGDLPRLDTNLGKNLIRSLAEIQAEFPDAVLHLHGKYAFSQMFGYKFGSVDFDARTTAKKGKVVLPFGREVVFEDAKKYLSWIRVCGMKPVDLKVPSNRCIYNIRAAIWAASNYFDAVNFRVLDVDVDFDLSDADWSPPEVPNSYYGRTRPGDKILCDTCSLASKCRFVREGAVCIMPDEEVTKLAEIFNTRNADGIIDGLKNVLVRQAKRADDSIEQEEVTGELSPEVTKILNSLFANGVKLAKLVDPHLNGGGTNVGVFVNGGTATLATASPNQLMSAVVAELEQQGYDRSDITPELVRNYLSEKAALGTS